jgi:hypothetical protein
VESLSYSARGNVEKIIFRAFSVAVMLTGIEVLGNAVIQNQYLYPTHWLLVVLVIGSQLGLLYGTWFGVKPKTWMIFHGLAPIVAILVWPLLANDGTGLPDGFRPWIWWAMGMSAISISVAFKPPLSLIGTIGITFSWFLFAAEPFGGSVELERRIQDSVLVLMLGGVFGSLAGLIIAQFGKVDEVNSNSLREAVARAQRETLERERGLVYALVHDRVLNTLLVAAKAKSDGEYTSASESAQQALLELSSMGPPTSSQQFVSSLALFQGLSSSAQEYDDVVVSSSGEGSISVPVEVAEALTQAALQAIENSKTHSGAKKTYLHTQGGKGKVEIVIIDHGKGFRTTRVSKNRLGVRLSIVGRVEAVGGKARVESQPGKGTEVNLSWTA